MRVVERYGRGRPVFSFEFFPPKTDQGFRSLFRTIQDLKQLNPDFVSVTWGAGGSTRRKTVELVLEIQREIGLTAMAHLSCIGSTPDELAETLGRLSEGGIENVLALGGDRPEGYETPPGGFTYASELVSFIRERWSFCVGGACYPETHVDAASPEADLAHLVQKVNAGVDFLVTQLFFDNQDYFDFVKRARAAGIEVPIVAGIMPVLNAKNIRRMTTLSGAKIPGELAARLAEVEQDDESTTALGIEWATMQCRELLEHGVPGIHFYTLNRSRATVAIFQKLLEA
ncbi:MAG: methylenetetrahydrofolate reductase [NAD(P)H] [Myxococcota bacterium]|nr:methylenetetrahydrofolate reductase [NAD(P)H] [Myxococcota bacterium]